MLVALTLFAAVVGDPKIAVSPQASTAQEAVPSPEGPPIDVIGERRNPLDKITCKVANRSEGSRIVRREDRVCLTRREWKIAEDKNEEFLSDLPRRNPRNAGNAGKTLPMWYED